MATDSTKAFKKVRALAKGVLQEGPSKTTAELAQGVLDLCHHIELDERAVNYTLKECGGHLTLATLINFYQSYEKDSERMKKAKMVALQAMDDHSNHVPVSEIINALSRISGESDL